MDIPFPYNLGLINSVSAQDSTMYPPPAASEIPTGEKCMNSTMILDISIAFITSPDNAG